MLWKCYSMLTKAKWGNKIIKGGLMRQFPFPTILYVREHLECLLSRRVESVQASLFQFQMFDVW